MGRWHGGRRRDCPLWGGLAREGGFVCTVFAQAAMPGRGFTKASGAAAARTRGSDCTAGVGVRGTGHGRGTTAACVRWNGAPCAIRLRARTPARTLRSRRSARRFFPDLLSSCTATKTLNTLSRDVRHVVSGHAFAGRRDLRFGPPALGCTTRRRRSLVLGRQRPRVLSRCHSSHPYAPPHGTSATQE